MALEKDREFYKKDPDTGEMIFDYVVRPHVRNNKLYPIPFGANIKINIQKNTELVIQFDYTVVNPISEGKVLGACAVWEVREVSNTYPIAPMGEVIICKDFPVMEKVDGEFVLDHVERPRNVRRDFLGGFVVGDAVHIEFLLNDVVLDSFDYVVESPITEGQVLVGMGSVDFVEFVA